MSDVCSSIFFAFPSTLLICDLRKGVYAFINNHDVKRRRKSSLHIHFDSNIKAQDFTEQSSFNKSSHNNEQVHPPDILDFYFGHASG